MQAALQLFGLETIEPFRGDCPRCGVDVLAVELADGAEVVVDVAEVLESFPCPQCAQVAGRGHERSDCDRCGKTGLIGEDLPLTGIAIDPAGRARVYRRSEGRPQDGEAIHLRHVCTQEG